MRAKRGALVCVLLLTVQPVVGASGADGNARRSWSARTLVLLGTVTAREWIAKPPELPRWRVTVSVDDVLFGTLAERTFTFGMGGTQARPPKVGRRYRIETSGRRPDDLAETAPLLDEQSVVPAHPFVGAIGYATLLPDADRDAAAVMVAFGTSNAPPPRDAIVTLVAADPAMPATRTRFACAERDDHGDDIAVHLQPIATSEWLAGQRVAADTKRRFPRVMVLPGDVPAARALAVEKIPSTALPAGTRPASLMVAVDSDGDGRPDFVARKACENGDACEERFCEEVWARLSGKWQRRDRTCGD